MPYLDAWALICLAKMSSAVLYWVDSRFLARPVERQCYCVEPSPDQLNGSVTVLNRRQTSWTAVLLCWTAARPVERQCYCVEPVDSPRPLFKAVVYSRSRVRNSVNNTKQTNANLGKRVTQKQINQAATRWIFGSCGEEIGRQLKSWTNICFWQVLHWILKSWNKSCSFSFVRFSHFDWVSTMLKRLTSMPIAIVATSNAFFFFQ